MTPSHSYGWYPDIPDQRDYYYKAIQPVVKLPKKADLREYCSAVEQQGGLGSCTAQALAGNIEFLDRMTDDAWTDVSRLYIYYNERVIEDSVPFDSGASLRAGIKTLMADGACYEETWPYLIERFAEKPSDECYAEGRKHLIESYHRIESNREMLVCLAEGFPFVFGFTVYESFEAEKVKKTGVAPMPKKGEVALGGHAVMAVGYDQTAKRFIVRNSWGTGWGKDGYFTMPFEYVETLGRDFWTIRK